MARIKNDPTQFITRSGKLPTFDRDAATCPKKTADREKSYQEAPVNKGFYIDHRKRSCD